MNPNKIIGPLFNPALGMLPLVLCVVVDYFTHYYIAFWAGLSLFIIWLLLSRHFFKHSPPYMLIVTGLIFMIYAGCSMFGPLRTIYTDYSLTFCEILFVLVFCFFNAFKGFVRERDLKRAKNETERSMRRTKLDEFFHIANLYKNVLIIHLSIVLIYKLLPETYHNPARNFFIFSELFVIFVILVIIYEYIRLSMLKKQINLEDWLPIVNETGGVTGRVALSVSQTSNRLFLHPIVRIALISNGLLYLKERSPRFVSDPNKIDYPFERFVFYKKTLEETIKYTLKKGCGIDDLPVRFVFRYVFKNPTTYRLTYLYTCNIHDEETMKTLDLGNGKLWTNKQIEENLSKGVFSECFEKEYEILKNTVLMAEKLVGNAD